jgi:hypothetical protein
MKEKTRIAVTALAELCNLIDKGSIADIELETIAGKRIVSLRSGAQAYIVAVATPYAEDVNEAYGYADFRTAFYAFVEAARTLDTTSRLLGDDGEQIHKEA